MTDLSPIDVSNVTSHTLKDQPSPQLIWVEVADLVVDHKYQREITSTGWAAIRRMAADFDWKRCAPILLATIEGGKFAIVDGQHRAHAAAACGVEKLPAMVVPMSRAEQASAFAAVNDDRVKMTLQMIYRAALAAGEQWAIDCHDAVAAADCTLATSNVTARLRKPRDIYALGLIRQMVKNGEAEAVTAGLQAISNSTQADEIDMWHGPVLAVWLPAIATNAQFLKADLASGFDQIDFVALNDRCRIEARATGQSGRSLAIAKVAQTLRETIL